MFRHVLAFILSTDFFFLLVFSLHFSRVLLVDEKDQQVAVCEVVLQMPTVVKDQSKRTNEVLQPLKMNSAKVVQRKKQDLPAVGPRSMETEQSTSKVNRVVLVNY